MEILKRPVGDLQLSDRCMSFLKCLHVQTLDDAVRLGWSGMVKHQDFDQLAFNELVRFLESNSILYLMQN